MKKSDFTRHLNEVHGKPGAVYQASMRQSMNEQLLPVFTGNDSLAKALASGDPGLTADDHTGFMQYHLVHTLPNYSKPGLVGGIMGLHPNVLRQSYQSMLYKPVNFEHRLQANLPEVSNDRMFGATITAEVGNAPSGMSASSTWEIGADKAAAPYLHGWAMFGKRIQGVRKFLGDHLSGVKVRSVSVELFSPLENMGVFAASENKAYPVMDAPDEWVEALYFEDGQLLSGQTKAGEQIVLVPGGVENTVQFAGYGVVEAAAEPTAGIGEVLASALKLRDRVIFNDRPGKVIEVVKVGTVQSGYMSLTATEENPVVRVNLDCGPVILARCEELKPEAAQD